MQLKIKLTLSAQAAIASLYLLTISLHGGEAPLKLPPLDEIRQLLPSTDSYLVDFKPLRGGMTNNIILCETHSNKYALRYPKDLDTSVEGTNSFNRVLHTCQVAAHLQISPPIYGWHDLKQQMLMRYIESSRWPAYQTAPEPYHATMHLLRKFHQSTNSAQFSDQIKSMCPFGWILESRLKTNPHMPEQIHKAFAKIKELETKVAPWLSTHAVLCHGDFHRGNVLLEDRNGTLQPWIIDYDSMAPGHPFFDVVKFLLGVDPAHREPLLKTYLDNKTPTKEQKEHFTIINDTFLMVVAIVRFKAALKSICTSNNKDILSKKEMEELLSSKDPLPSQKTIPSADPSPKMKQLGAVYALHEFLRKDDYEKNWPAL